MLLFTVEMFFWVCQCMFSFILISKSTGSPPNLLFNFYLHQKWWGYCFHFVGLSVCMYVCMDECMGKSNTTNLLILIPLSDSCSA